MDYLHWGLKNQTKTTQQTQLTLKCTKIIFPFGCVPPPPKRWLVAIFLPSVHQNRCGNSIFIASEFTGPGSGQDRLAVQAAGEGHLVRHLLWHTQPAKQAGPQPTACFTATQPSAVCCLFSAKCTTKAGKRKAKMTTCSGPFAIN